MTQKQGKGLSKATKNIKFFSIFIGLFLSLGVFAKGQSDSTLDSKLRYFQSSDTLSKFVRDNAPHYWAYMKLHKSDMQDFASFNGQSVGDAHFGNFNFLPMVSGQKEKVKAVVIDLDDGGKASLAADFIRMVVNAKAIDKDLRNETTTKMMVEAYIKGLNEEGINKPSFVDDIKATVTIDGLRQLQADFLAKHTIASQNGLKFKMKPDVLEPFPTKAQSRYMSDVQKALAQEYGSGIQLIQLGKRPRDRGGSAEAGRFWALYKDKSGTYFIREFKQIVEPGVAEFMNQPISQNRLSALQSVVFSGVQIDFKVVTIAGYLYWMRPKNIELIDVPYHPTTNKEFSLLEDMMTYYSYALGKIHGVNQNVPGYVIAVTQNSKSFRDMVDEVSGNYVDLMKSKRKN